MPMCADTCTNNDRDARLRRALDSVVRPGDRERHGIGMQKEKTLHAVLKAYEDPDEDHHEIPVGNYIADIYCTAKWVTWIDPETGEFEKRNRSPKKGSFYAAFKELYRISGLLDHPNLTIKLILLDMEEYRLRDGWGRDGKRGSHRYDRVPTQIVSELTLTEPRDYLQFIPYGLEEPFTAKELAKCCGFPRDSFSTVALILKKMGALEQVGKRGRAYLYRAAE